MFKCLELSAACPWPLFCASVAVCLFFVSLGVQEDSQQLQELCQRLKCRVIVSENTVLWS